MSNDLISRKALIEDMRGRPYIDKALCEIFETIVDDAPTAYDVDTVCEKLGKFTKGECTLHECGIRSERCNECMAGKAIEIVRNGGKKE